ncbi:MAG TPA: excinuclease ABC subunit UvrB [Acidimicrobiales bacterium]|nr:excinuclease ABC subunit UvrB [Acidimicrobiales bacterium]
MPEFEVVSPFRPSGDQPEAIRDLVAGVTRGDRYQTLLGITGSGKTATIAWTVEALQRPTLIIEPNKSLAAQLASELKGFFPHNRVEYFVSYYDYYQPEAYVPSSDTYIEKDSSINDEIDRLRHATTSSLLLRRDTIVVASVSCIYGLGSPDEYRNRIVALKPGEVRDQRSLLRRLVDLQYTRNDLTLSRGQFRARGDTVEIHAAYEEQAVRIEFFGDTIERIRPFDVMTGEIGEDLEELVIFAKTHYGTGDEKMRKAILGIESELRERLVELEKAGKLLESQRLRMRTEYDLEMLAETGVCAGVENYSRHLDGRQPGEAPFTLLDFFPKDFLVVLDESHVAVPQLRGQFAGDRSRKETLVDHGFRLPSAVDNRPLRFEEFIERTGQTIMLSATPGPWEFEHSAQVVEQVIRPTGLLDPEVDIRPTTGQIDDLRERIDATVADGYRVLVTTLTKKMAEDLTAYLAEHGVRVEYLHSDVDTMARIELLRELRMGMFDVLVGINLLREGLDLPEVALVAILDADKEGFLRSSSSLIQTMGRAARNVNGRVIMYADTVTESMTTAIGETQRRRARQIAYNQAHGIDPQTITKAVSDILQRVRSDGREEEVLSPGRARRAGARRGTERRPGGVDPRAAAAELAGAIGPDADQLSGLIHELDLEMQRAAEELRFEEAALLRDEVAELRALLVKDPVDGSAVLPGQTADIDVPADA